MTSRNDKQCEFNKHFDSNVVHILNFGFSKLYFLIISLSSKEGLHGFRNHCIISVCMITTSR